MEKLLRIAKTKLAEEFNDDITFSGMWHGKTQKI